MARLSNTMRAGPHQRALLGLAAAVLLAGWGGGAHAEGTLDKIKRRGQINLGYRVDAAPFSYLDARKKPVGYSIDVCGEVVAQLRSEMGAAELHVKFVPVDIDRVVRFVGEGSIDLLCTSTSDTPQRRAQMAFSKPIFLDGVAVMVRQQNGYKQLADLQGKEMVAIKASTSVPALEDHGRQQSMQWKVEPALNADAALSALQLGWAAGYARDAVPLALQRATLPAPQDYALLPERLSVETIAIAMPLSDGALRSFVDKVITGAAASGKADTLYAKWFTQPIDFGGRQVTLGIPMSPVLRAALTTTK